MGSAANSYMRKDFVVYEAFGHIWLCNHSLLDFLIYEEFFFFFYQCRLKDIICLPMVMYCLMSLAISMAWSVWILEMRCCIRFPHFMSRYSVPSSVSICRVEITYHKPNNLSNIIVIFFFLHTVPKIWFMYSRKWNYATSFPIPTFICLWAIYSQDRSAFFSCSKIGRPIQGYI